jgi:hypothetical protein
LRSPYADHLVVILPNAQALEIVGEGGVYLALMGPASELDKCRPAFDGFGTEYFPMDGPNGVWKK